MPRFASINRAQSQLYYARKRRRSLRSTPRLYRSASVPIGASVSGNVVNSDLDRPITFLVRVDIGSPNRVFSWGDQVEVEVQASAILLTFPFATVTVPHVQQGEWDLVLSIRPGDGTAQLWNQRDTLWRSENLPFGGQWSAPDQTLTVDASVLSDLGIYTAQLPRHFGAEGAAQLLNPVQDDFWLNSTALNFMTGFPTPLFEGDV